MENYLHIIVNGKWFGPDAGVSANMDGGEIAGLVGIPANRAVVYLEASLDLRALRIETHSCSTATRDSGVRVTHIPTGTVAYEDHHSSQHKNRTEAMFVLRELLYASGQAQRKRIEVNERIPIDGGSQFSVTSI